MTIGYFGHTNVNPSETFIYDLLLSLTETSQSNLL
jgi:hypothetical protein